MLYSKLRFGFTEDINSRRYILLTPCSKLLDSSLRPTFLLARSNGSIEKLHQIKFLIAPLMMFMAYCII